MNQEDLIKKVAQLETINDQLSAELQYIDYLAKQIGFNDGLNTLKSAAEELYEEQIDKTSDQNE